MAAGDAKVDNGKYKAAFGGKAKMLTAEEAVERIGHAVGGVCPFAVNDGVEVYLDQSLRRFDTVYPAAGSASSAVRLDLAELERAARPVGWVDVCKNWDNAVQIKERAHDAKSVVVIGAGYIGAELAEQFSTIGVETTLIDAANRVLANNFDKLITDQVEERYRFFSFGDAMFIGSRIDDPENKKPEALE